MNDALKLHKELLTINAEIKNVHDAVLALKVENKALKEALAQQSNEQDFDPNSELTDSEKNILENANTLLSSLKKQKQQSNEQVDKQTVTVLPDGSAFAIASYPLPETHWLYAKREYADGEDEPIELGKPILTHEVRDAVISAVRYAVRGATMCGKESDFDPDALVQNAVYALCGPYTPVAHPPVPTAQPKEPEQEPVAITITGKLGNIYSFTGDYSLKKGDKVYTTPPQRKPLTDEEIGAILEGVNAYGTRLYTFARAIEATHGIKEKNT